MTLTELILAINPGSTSTKLGVFDGERELIEETIEHPLEQLAKYPRIIRQRDFRLDYITAMLAKNKIELKDFKAIVGRGGLLRPIPGGTYLVNDRMIEELTAENAEEHASNLGGILARVLADESGCPAYIVDPVIVDELAPVARLSGWPELERRSVFHALNHKAIAQKYAREIGRNYEQLSLIVAHLGGGISVGLHDQGKVIDVNNALSGEGPFSPNRTGGLSTFDLARLCFSGKYSFAEIKKILLKEGGLIAYLGTADIRRVEEMIEQGDKKAALVFEALIYQVAKEIGSLAPVLNGKIDAIILTGGVAYSERFISKLSPMVEFIAPVKLYPGAEELSALAAGAYRVLTGLEEARIYGEPPEI